MARMYSYSHIFLGLFQRPLEQALLLESHFLSYSSLEDLFGQVRTLLNTNKFSMIFRVARKESRFSDPLEVVVPRDISDLLVYRQVFLDIYLNLDKDLMIPTHSISKRRVPAKWLNGVNKIQALETDWGLLKLEHPS